MTDLEKAKHAAQVFANYEFQRITVWMVEEISTNYMVFGHTESPVDLERLSLIVQAEVHSKCCRWHRYSVHSRRSLFDGAIVREGRLNPGNCCLLRNIKVEYDRLNFFTAELCAR